MIHLFLWKDLMNHLQFLPDGQLNPELDGDEVEKDNLNCETDTSRIVRTGSVMSKTALSPKDTYCQEELELPNGLSSFKFTEESSRFG
jgi:hypothetical protein